MSTADSTFPGVEPQLRISIVLIYVLVELDGLQQTSAAAAAAAAAIYVLIRYTRAAPLLRSVPA